VRFDGLRFTLFDRANSGGIGSNRFTPLLEAADGAFWLGTENSGVTRYYQGRFTTYTTGVDTATLTGVVRMQTICPNSSNSDLNGGTCVGRW
jgi:ligand-binding sensor domain-containing protein